MDDDTSHVSLQQHLVMALHFGKPPTLVKSIYGMLWTKNLDNQKLPHSAVAPTQTLIVLYNTQ